ncbi:MULTISPECIES: hypothetical protein [unclassified Rhizobium]|uniref:hypothetical protein n=1 Tax=unclassified Rhizobium TaxID=2613769 RepID=UPI001613F66A|nr:MULTISPECIES: hypothetical protein [unclassified Rhizobium]MBB3386007.1 hypothetical protein [Rhizobium sp. BK098]MBB3617816.1 hypothetical protein [Rhizobium sp. BK609]MBB3683369.1 hypothetical protein [Rhizobium sp. BK612]
MMPESNYSRAIDDVVAADDDRCPVCAEIIKPDDMCSTDIELGICHAACLEGSPHVDLETDEQLDGPIPTYRYGDLDQPKGAEDGKAD